MIVANTLFEKPAEDLGHMKGLMAGGRLISHASMPAHVDIIEDGEEALTGHDDMQIEDEPRHGQCGDHPLLEIKSDVARSGYLHGERAVGGHSMLAPSVRKWHQGSRRRDLTPQVLVYRHDVQNRITTWHKDARWCTRRGPPCAKVRCYAFAAVLQDNLRLAGAPIHLEVHDGVEVSEQLEECTDGLVHEVRVVVATILNLPRPLRA